MVTIDMPSAPVGARSGVKGLISRILWGAGILFIGGWVLFNIALFVWVILNSFRGGSAIFSRPFELPDKWNLDNYLHAWLVSDLAVGFVNSVVLVGVATAVTVLLAALAAQALSRTVTRTASPITSLFAIGLGIPVQVIIVPIFVWMHQISSFAYQTVGWWDDRISLFLLYVSTSLPFAVFLLTGFFKSLPSEVEEAAALDGAGPVRSFFAVMWPMARPGIVTASMLTALGLWNETLLALVFITDDEKNTLPQALLGLYGTMQYTSDWGSLFAGIVIVVLPTLIAYILLGRRFVEGMTLGAGK